MNRRDMIKAIGATLCAGMTPKFIPALLSQDTKLSGVFDFQLGEEVVWCGTDYATKSSYVVFEVSNDKITLIPV